MVVYWFLGLVNQYPDGLSHIINHTKSECTNCNITCNQDPEKPSCNYMNISGDQFYLTVYPVQSSCESVALEFRYVTERQVKKFGRSLLYKWKPN